MLLAQDTRLGLPMKEGGGPFGESAINKSKNINLYFLVNLISVHTCHVANPE